MKQVQSAYQSKIDIAEELAFLGARAVTISAVAKTNAADSRDIFKRIRKAQSQSGQTPKDHQWFFANRARRLHGALLLLLYCKYRTGLNIPHDGHGIAFAMTLRTYHKLYPNSDDQVVSPERFSLLVTVGFQFGWQKIIRGEASKFRSDNLKVMKCRKCNLPHVAEAHYRTYVCPLCETAST